MAAPEPRSCDTFVYVAGPGGPAATLFGKNSDRPSDESHEVVYFPAAKHAAGSSVRCTYIEIPQAAETLAVVLSRPGWLWGCEMGANEHGVVGGNEAISSLLADELGDEARLLGMDLLRLALERGRTAREATEVCCELLEAHGQGGCCSEEQDGWTYENGFLFADAKEAFVLETAGVRHWCVERVPPGTPRNISNGLSIRNSIDSCSAGIRELCRARGWWDGASDFDWKICVGSGGRSAGRGLEVYGREKAGGDHLKEMGAAVGRGELDASNAAGWVRRMAGALRDDDSGICFRDLHGFNSTGSQISWLPPPGAGGEASHLFTAASDPMVACYKRFAFSEACSEGNHRSLELWRRWREVALKGGLTRCYAEEKAAAICKGMRELEAEAVTAISGPAAPAFAAAVERELKLLGTA